MLTVERYGNVTRIFILFSIFAFQKICILAQGMSKRGFVLWENYLIFISDEQWRL